MDWHEPKDPTDLSHLEASETLMQFFSGWFANPILVDGKYPEIMRQKVLFFKYTFLNIPTYFGFLIFLD
jgi:hypothetical protein